MVEQHRWCGDELEARGEEDPVAGVADRWPPPIGGAGARPRPSVGTKERGREGYGLLLGLGLGPERDHWA